MAKKAARKRKRPAPKKPVKWSVWFRKTFSAPCETGQAILAFILAMEKKGHSPTQIWKLGRRLNVDYIQEFINWYSTEEEYSDMPDEYLRLERLTSNSDLKFAPEFTKALKHELARLKPPVHDLEPDTMPCPLVYADGSVKLQAKRK